MKKIFLLLITVTVIVSANDISWVNNQIEAIKPTRKGIADKKISLIKDPFVFLDKNRITKKKNVSTKKQKMTSKKINYKAYKSHIRRSPKKPYRVQKLKLNAIMNKSALINNKWYNLGDNVYGYTLIEVNYNKVVLKKGKKSITLTTLSMKKNTLNRIEK